MSGSQDAGRPPAVRAKRPQPQRSIRPTGPHRQAAAKEPTHTVDCTRHAMYVHFARRSRAPTRTTVQMARKKISTTVYITPEQNEQLKLLHDRTKVPIAVYIREGIDLVLRRHADELPGQLSLTAADD